MKARDTSIGMHIGTIHAGVISLLVFVICYLWMTGISDWPGAWLFMVSFAICFVLMTKAIVALLVMVFCIAAKFSGRAVGLSVKLIRRTFSRQPLTA